MYFVTFSQHYGAFISVDTRRGDDPLGGAEAGGAPFCMCMNYMTCVTRLRTQTQTHIWATRNVLLDVFLLSVRAEQKQILRLRLYFVFFCWRCCYFCCCNLFFRSLVMYVIFAYLNFFFSSPFIFRSISLFSGSLPLFGIATDDVCMFTFSEFRCFCLFNFFFARCMFFSHFFRTKIM